MRNVLDMDLWVPDFESKLMMDVFPNMAPSMHPDEVKKIERHLRDRKQMVSIGVKRCPSWFQEALMKIDPHLRCWWDVSLKEDPSTQRKTPNGQPIPGTGDMVPRNEWVIDRYQHEGTVEGLLRLADEDNDPDAKAALKKSATGLLESGRYYLTVMRFKPEGELQLNDALLDMLRASDMQAYKSPADYIREKNRKADAIAAANERAGDDKVKAGIDKVKDPATFMAACNAMATGDTITAHGDDLKVMEGIEEARRKAPPIEMPRPIKRKKRERL